LSKIKFIFLSIFLMIALVLCSCSSALTTTASPAPTSAVAPTPAKTSSPASASTPASGPQKGGTLKIIAPPGLSNIGIPGVAYTSGATQYVRPAVEYIMSFDPKGSGASVPQLATSWQWSSDYKTLTLTLRQGVKFQDGTDFNAAAAKYVLDLQREGVRAELKSVTSIDVVDNFTIKLNLKAYDSAVLQGLGSLVGWIVSPSGLQKNGKDAAFIPIGTGPFKFVSYDRDVSLKYARWDGYWQKGKPYLDGLEYTFIKDPVTQVAALKAGEAQVLKQVGIKDLPDLKASGKFDFVTYPAQAIGLAGDSAHPNSPYSKMQVRQALACAIDSAAIAKAIGGEYYKPANQFFAPDGPYYNQSVKGYPYNPARAKQLLAEAGYPNGFETTFTYDSTNLDALDMCPMVQNYLNAVGIKTKLDPVDPAKFLQVAQGGWTNQLVYLWCPVARAVPPATTMGNMVPGGRYDTKSLFVPDDFFAKYKVAISEPDSDKARPLFQELSRIMIDDYCLAVPIMAPYNVLVKTKNVQDLDLLTYAMSEWLPENAWLSK
jgi:peptide/nickel transport system substrate-binding protein